MKDILIKGGQVVNEGKKTFEDILVQNGRIEKVATSISPPPSCEIIDAENKLILPGLIDDQVHFREPGLTHKATIQTESQAAVAGGITTFFEMPNVSPPTLDMGKIEEKCAIAQKGSSANYAFFLGASNENLESVKRAIPEKIAGVKVFMGSSTGNMLVDEEAVLEQIFKFAPTPIATHCEDTPTILANEERARAKYGEEVPFQEHPNIRSREACLESSTLAVELAQRENARLHVLHITTAEELALFSPHNKRITAEACIHHLWFTDAQYDSKGTLIKWNPAVKSEADRDAVLAAGLDDRIDIIATDHAPHTIEEKTNKYFNAPSGGPLVQHAMVAVLELVRKGKITIEKAVRKMSHAPAECFQIPNRGYIKKGFQADLVLVNLNNPWTVTKSNILYKCGWSPFEGEEFAAQIKATFINGVKVYEDGKIIELASNPSQRMIFSR